MYRYSTKALAAFLLLIALAIATLPTHSLKEGDTLIYDVDMRMKASGIGIQDINMRVYGTVKITIINMTEDYIAIKVEPNLNVEGAPAEYANITSEMNKVQTLKVPTYGMLGPLSEEGGPSLNDIISMLQQQLQALGFNETNIEVSEVTYNGVPAIKLTMSLNASNYLGTGSNIVIRSVSYTDMSTMALLHGEASAKYSASTGGFELNYRIDLTNPEVLQQSLASYDVEVEGGSKLSMIFAGAGLSVSDPAVEGDKVKFTVSGEGMGSIIIKKYPGSPSPKIYIDGAPAQSHTIIRASDGTEYYKVPIKFSQHEVEVVLGKTVAKASAVKLSLPTEGGAGGALGGQYMTIIIVAAAVAAVAVAAVVGLKLSRRKKVEEAPPTTPATPEAPPTPPPPPST